MLNISELKADFLAANLCMFPTQEAAELALRLNWTLFETLR